MKTISLIAITAAFMSATAVSAECYDGLDVAIDDTFKNPGEKYTVELDFNTGSVLTVGGETLIMVNGAAVTTGKSVQVLIVTGEDTSTATITATIIVEGGKILTSQFCTQDTRFAL